MKNLLIFTAAFFLLSSFHPGPGEPEFKAKSLKYYAYDASLNDYVLSDESNINIDIMVKDQMIRFSCNDTGTEFTRSILKEFKPKKSKKGVPGKYRMIYLEMSNEQSGKELASIVTNTEGKMYSLQIQHVDQNGQIVGVSEYRE